MVKINNLAVIQKLVDELNLYPGTDQIPTELADKILPCFLVNSQEITMTPTPSNVIAEGVSVSGATTIYTVPSTGKFYLTNAGLIGSAFANLTGSRDINLSVTINGATKELLSITLESGFTTANTPISSTFNLQNPILLDQGSLITVAGASTQARAQGNIVGYTTD